MNLQIIDIEEFSKENKQIPKGCKYKIKVDKAKYIVDSSTITGKEILELAGKTPHTKWMLNQRVKGGGVVKIGYDEVVDLTTPGIEKFQTLPLDQTDGELRKQFSLPEEDMEYLEALNIDFETIIEGNNRWLIIQKFSVPEGYNVVETQAAIKIENGYPVAQLDMIYFNPALTRKDNKPIKAITNMVIDGRNFQRWSRHRTPQNPWRSGVDDISTHISLANFWLEREFLNEAA
jgi:hypothetical protein